MRHPALGREQFFDFDEALIPSLDTFRDARAEEKKESTQPTALLPLLFIEKRAAQITQREDRRAKHTEALWAKVATRRSTSPNAVSLDGVTLDVNVDVHAMSDAL